MSASALLRYLRLTYSPPTPDAELLRQFVANRDDSSFRTIVERHGPMVLRMCRRKLGQADADDAFQAVFLTFARKARSINKPVVLASWLHAVAWRVSGKMLAQRSRRSMRRPANGTQAPRDPSEELTARELFNVLDEELELLAEHERMPLVLVYWQGRTQAEAARELGITNGALAGRLDRGRKRLAQRMTDRGFSASDVKVLLIAPPTAAAVSGELLARTAALAASGAVVPATIAALAGGTSKLLISVPVILALAGAGLLGMAASGMPFSSPNTDPPEKESPAVAVKPVAESLPVVQDKKTLTVDSWDFAGRVVNIDGKPLPGAKVFVAGFGSPVNDFQERAVAADDGGFRFTVRRDEFKQPRRNGPPEQTVFIAASAAGHGATCLTAIRPEEREHLTMWLPPEEVANGKIVDDNNQPVTGVRVTTHLEQGRLDKNRRPLPFDTKAGAGTWMVGFLPFDKERQAAVSDRDGKVTLRGISKDWLYVLRADAPTIVSQENSLAARPQLSKDVTPGGGKVPGIATVTQFGNSFTITVALCKPIVGIVREQGTGTPIAGVEITRRDNHAATVRAVSDKNGQYALTGLPHGSHRLIIRPPINTPYLHTEVRADAHQASFEPMTLDIDLKRQPSVTGRLTDPTTGRPVFGYVEYRPLASNPNLSANPILAEKRLYNRGPVTDTDTDGRFTIPTLAGPGVILTKAGITYLPARITTIDSLTAGVADPGDPELLDCRPFPAWPGEYHAYQIVNVVEGKSTEVAITFMPGKSRPLLVEYPDGVPSDTSVYGLAPNWGSQQYVAEFSVVTGLAVGEVRRLILSTYDHKAAVFAAVNANESGPVTIKLKSTGALVGRVLNSDGTPVIGSVFRALYEDEPDRHGTMVQGSLILRSQTTAGLKRDARIGKMNMEPFKQTASNEKTDAEGHFRLPGIVPDVAFDLELVLVAPNDKGQRVITGEMVIAHPTVKPGETLDLGDLKIDPPPKKRP